MHENPGKRARASCAAVVLAVAAVVATTAARPGASADAPLGPGPELIAPFKTELKQALQAGLAEGPGEAVAACQMKAPAIAAEHSKNGVRVGRTSHRLRNPANVSPEWVQPILEAYLADTSNRAPRSVTVGPGREGYVEPIVMAPLCETCHGTQIAPDVQARIDALYPHDEATGFEAGELRGVFWVEYPVAIGEDP